MLRTSEDKRRQSSAARIVETEIRHSRVKKCMRGERHRLEKQQRSRRVEQKKAARHGFRGR